MLPRQRLRGSSFLRKIGPPRRMGRDEAAIKAAPGTARKPRRVRLGMTRFYIGTRVGYHCVINPTWMTPAALAASITRATAPKSRS